MAERRMYVPRPTGMFFTYPDQMEAINQLKDNLVVGVLTAKAMDMAVPAAPGQGFVSGRPAIIQKVRAARAGNVSAAAEIQAAKALRAEGLNVYFRTAAGDIGIEGKRTSDFLVGGFRGGFGGTPMEVFSPFTANAGRIAGNSQQSSRRQILPHT